MFNALEPPERHIAPGFRCTYGGDHPSPPLLFLFTRYSAKG
jgi:hypothetical protein